MKLADPRYRVFEQLQCLIEAGIAAPDTFIESAQRVGQNRNHARAIHHRHHMCHQLAFAGQQIFGRFAEHHQVPQVIHLG
jgi:hypothetical protein